MFYKKKVYIDLSCLQGDQIYKLAVTKLKQKKTSNFHFSQKKYFQQKKNKININLHVDFQLIYSYFEKKTSTVLQLD